MNVYNLLVVFGRHLRYDIKKESGITQKTVGAVGKETRVCMFGYVRTWPPELRGREQEYYRGVYCGLCRAQGKCTGTCSRATLNYDMTFMALVRLALTGETPVFTRRRCVVHPVHRRVMAEPNASLTMTALCSALLTYHKVADDKADETGLRFIRAEAVTPVVAGARRRALRRMADGQKPQGEGITPDGQVLDGLVADCMQALAETESKRPPSVDQPAELFGVMMGDMLAFGLEGDAARLARDIGRHTGRWVYILDAADDYEEDVRRKRYNPYVCLYGEGMTTLPEERKQEIRTALIGELVEIEAAFDLMEIPDRNLDGVLRNILYEGMPRVADRVLWGEPEKHGPAGTGEPSGGEAPGA